MHSFLKAIGFSDIKSRLELEKLFNIIKEQYTKSSTVQLNNRATFSEISIEFAEGIGITLRGEYDENEVFHMEHYFPYIMGQGVNVTEEIGINKRVDTEAYTCMCDDYRLGVSLIFYLQNITQYMEKTMQKMPMDTPFDISLSALSLEGRILFPIEKDEVHVKNLSAETKYRNKLIAEAKKGNQDAIDSLTIDDIDTYALISRRAKKEDIYSIVDTCFIPFGSESDNYSIIATILDCNKINNSYTEEDMYDMQLMCNDISFRMCINKKNLLGEPKIGRRFKGNIWMQGHVAFTNQDKE